MLFIPDYDKRGQMTYPPVTLTRGYI